MKLGVYGLGRFGAFWAGSLAKKTQVFGYSRSSRPDVPGMALCSFEELCSCDVIVLCVAISAMESALDKLAPAVKPGCLVMDTCSVKMEPVRLMKEKLPETVNIIATHPMFGPDSGKNGIRGLPLVFSPVRCTEEQEKSLRSFFSDMKLDVIEMTPEEHDREAAYTQGITHFIGRVLNDLNLKPSKIGTLGYKKILEIVEQTCNDPYQLFLDLQKYNPYTREMREKLMASISQFLKLPEFK